MKVWKYDQDSINTDMLFPGKYTYTCSTPEDIRPHLLEDLDKDFAEKVEEGDVVMGGRNFGCGSSREQPVLGLKAVGIKAVIAKSFARIFYRSAINQGLLLIEAPDAVEYYKEGSDFAIDIDGGKIVIDDRTFTFPKLPPQIMNIREPGGLLQYTREQLKKERG